MPEQIYDIYNDWICAIAIELRNFFLPFSSQLKLKLNSARDVGDLRNWQLKNSLIIFGFSLSSKGRNFYEVSN